MPAWNEDQKRVSRLRPVFVWFLFTFSWKPERETFILLRGELEDVVGIQVSGEPYQDNDSKDDEAGAVIDHREERQQKNPEGGIISRPDQGERVSCCLFDGCVIS